MKDATGAMHDFQTAIKYDPASFGCFLSVHLSICMIGNMKTVIRNAIRVMVTSLSPKAVSYDKSGELDTRVSMTTSDVYNTRNGSSNRKHPS